MATLLALGPTCSSHPQRPAIAACRRCASRLCDDCFRFLIGEEPRCAACAWSEANQERRRTSLAITFVLVAWAIAFLLSRRGVELALVGITAVLAPVLAGATWALTRGAGAPEVRDREPEAPFDEASAMAPAAHPYRARARRAALAAAPRVSGSAVVLIILASLAVCAVAAPKALDLPRWVEVEAAILGFWGLFSLVLGVLLYRGYRLRDDFTFVAPWKRGRGYLKNASGCDGLSGCDGCSDPGEAVVVLVVLVVALLGAAILVELLVPAAFLAVYVVLMKALRTAAHDHHGCTGSVGKSVAWGAAWGLLFTLPIAGVTYLLHLALPGF